MVKQLPFLLFMFFYITSFQAFAKSNITLDLSANKTTIQYGKHINLYLRIDKKIYNEMNHDIQSLIQPLEKIFNINATLIIQTPSNVKYKIKARPLKTGTITIPRLTYKNHQTNILKIISINPTSSDKKDIKFNYLTINNTPWEREQVIIRAQIITSDKDIQLNTKNIQHEGIKSYPLKHHTYPTIINGNKFYIHSIGWSVYFLYQQNVNIKLPSIEYLKNSIPLFKFNTKDVKFSVKPLPIYIPPTTPVGRIKLKSTLIGLPTHKILQPGTTNTIKYTLSGRGVPAYWLPSISQYFVQYYNQRQYIHTGTTSKNVVSESNVHGYKTINIAFTTNKNGTTTLEDIKLPYFDPESGKLKIYKHSHENTFVLNIYLQIILFIIIAFIVYSLLNITYKKISAYIRRCHLQRLCLTSIVNASTANDLRKALVYFSNAEKWQKNNSLNQWLNQYSQNYIASKKLTDTFFSINKSMYAKNINEEQQSTFENWKNILFLEIKNRVKIKR